MATLCSMLKASKLSSSLGPTQELHNNLAQSSRIHMANLQQVSIRMAPGQLQLGLMVNLRNHHTALLMEATKIRLLMLAHLQDRGTVEGEVGISSSSSSSNSQVLMVALQQVVPMGQAGEVTSMAVHKGAEAHMVSQLQITEQATLQLRAMKHLLRSCPSTA